MTAIVQVRFGPPGVLRLAEIDRPEAGAGQVLVRVHAAAFNPCDWPMMRGDPFVARLMGGRGVDAAECRVAGIDAAGRVEAVGVGVRGLRPGRPTRTCSLSPRSSRPASSPRWSSGPVP